MQTQLTHQQFKQSQKNVKTDLVFVLENLEHAENIGSAFRLADAFNIQKIYIVANNKLNFDKINKTARNCQNTVDFEVCENITEVISYLKKQDYQIYNLEITNKSKPLRQIDFYNQKTALIVGNEKYGVSDLCLSLVENSIHIEMYGNNSSMNVITALAIATYKISEDQLQIGNCNKI